MKNLLLITLFFSLLFLDACSSNKNFKEAMPIEQMKYLVWDMLKADEYYVQLISRDTAKKFQKENLRLYDQIFRSYGVTKENFYYSFKYYESHPNLFKELIDSVESLSKKQRNVGLDTSGKLSK